MWYPYEKKLAVDSPRIARPPSRKTPLDLDRLSTANSTKDPFYQEDDRKSKITIVSLKSDRTSRTVQTLPPVVEQPPKPKPTGAKAALKKVKDGFRESSIKRIIASGLSIATALLLTAGVFLPFWHVYTTTSIADASTTGYYGGLWGYCIVVTGGSTDCSSYVEADLDAWFRAVRFLELMAFFGIITLIGFIIAYMFCLRDLKYVFIQWIIVTLCFGTAVFTLLGLIVYGSMYPNSDHLSSAYGLTFCSFFGCLIAGGLFLWDKLELDKEIKAKEARRAAAPSRARSHRSQAFSHRSRRSHAKSQISQGSAGRSTALGSPMGVVGAQSQKTLSTTA